MTILPFSNRREAVLAYTLFVGKTAEKASCVASKGVDANFLKLFERRSKFV